MKLATLPLVSVITGYHNRKENLKESVQSILDQTYPNFEFIIFDDCSSDGTYELLLEFVDPRLKIIRHENNIGFTDGMIDAINRASGEIIAVHGAGDLSFPDRLAKQVDVLSQNLDVAVVGCFYNNYNAINGTVDRVRMNSHYERKDLTHTTPISHGGATYRKRQYLAVGGYRSIFKFVQDGELWLRLTTLGSIRVVQEVLYQRNVFADGVSFNIKKTIQQSKYSLLARDINSLTSDEQKKIIDECTISGIDAIILYNDKRIQKGIFKKFHTVLDVHDADKLKEFLQYSSGSYKVYYSLLIYGYKFRLFRNVVKFMHYRVYKPAKLSFKRLTT